MKIERTRIHFFSDVFTAVAVLRSFRSVLDIHDGEGNENGKKVKGFRLAKQGDCEQFSKMSFFSVAQIVEAQYDPIPSGLYSSKVSETVTR